MKLPQYVENILNFLAEKDEKYFKIPRAEAYERMKDELIDESLTAKNPVPRQALPESEALRGRDGGGKPVSEEKTAAEDNQEILRKLDEILRQKEHLTKEDIEVLNEIKADHEQKKNPKPGHRKNNPRRSEGMKPSDFDQEQLKVGREHETEHTDNPDEAMRIAMDHLAEDPDYYKKLAKMEAGKCDTKTQENPVPTLSELRVIFKPSFDSSVLGKSVKNDEEREKIWREVEIFIKHMVDFALTNIMGLQLKRSETASGQEVLGALEFREDAYDEAGNRKLTEKEVEENRNEVEMRRYYKLVLTSYLISLIRRFFYVRRPQVHGLLNSLEAKKTWKQLAKFQNREANAAAVKLGMDAIMKNVGLDPLSTWLSGNEKEVKALYAKAEAEWKKEYSEEGKKRKEKRAAEKKKIVAERPVEPTGEAETPKPVTGKTLGLTKMPSGEEIIEILQDDPETIEMVKVFLEKNKGSKSPKIAALREFLKKKT